jgi:hypothetical protein
VRIVDRGALAEQGVGLVEQQDRVGVLGGGEHAVQVLLGLTDVLADHPGQVDPVQVEAQLPGDDLGAHGLAGAGRPREQRVDAASKGQLGREPPLPQHPLAGRYPLAQLPQLRERVRRQHDVVPARHRAELGGDGSQPMPGLGPRSDQEVAQREPVSAAQPAGHGGGRDGVVDLARRKAEPAGEDAQVRLVDGVVDRGQAFLPAAAARSEVADREGDGDDAERPSAGGDPWLGACEHGDASVAGQAAQHGLPGRPGGFGPERVQPLQVQNRLPEASVTESEADQLLDVGLAHERPSQVNADQPHAGRPGQRLGHPGLADAGWALEVEPQRLPAATGTGDAGGQGVPLAQSGRHGWRGPWLHHPGEGR